MAPSVARESTLHCKLDSHLHGAPVRSILWVGGKSIMEIPDRIPICRRLCNGVVWLRPEAALRCNTVKSCFLAGFSYELRYYDNKNDLVVWLRLRCATR
jgi:hypothetical protein